MKEQLKELGLSDGEAQVYLQLLKVKKQSANEISTETKINRSVVYSVLDSLVEKGLSNYLIIDNKKYFSATSPNYLKEFLKDKEAVLASIMPDLNNLNAEDKNPVSVEVYQGIKGGIAVIKDALKEGKDFVTFGDEGQFQSILQGTIAEQYLRQIREKKIKERIITKRGVKLLIDKNLSSVRYLPKEFSFPTITTVYGDKVAICIFDKPYYVILIKSKTLAFSYKSLFEGLWKIAKE